MTRNQLSEAYNDTQKQLKALKSTQNRQEKETTAKKEVVRKGKENRIRGLRNGEY